MSNSQRPRFPVIVAGGTVITENAAVHADVAIDDGHIAAIGDASGWNAEETIDATGLYLMPGVVDPHTHWGSLGNFALQCRNDSRAAALGGTTTAGVLHRTTPDGFGDVLQAAQDNSYVDFIISPTVTSRAHAELVDRTLDTESSSIKFFLSYRDVPGALPGDTWNQLTPSLFEQTLRRMGRRRGSLACVHAEDSDIIAKATSAAVRSRGDGLLEWESANPASAEVEAIGFAGRVGRETGVTLYFVHLSGAEALAALRTVKGASDQVYGETCPHYLILDRTSSTKAKFSPPVRSRSDSEALWEALGSGLLDTIGSDNSTTTLAEKSGGVWSARRGGPEAGFVLPVVLSEGVRGGYLDLVRAAAVTSTNAAKIFGLYPLKGVLAVGSDADIAIVDLDKHVHIDPTVIASTAEYTLYDGAVLRGWPVMTMLRGMIICRDGELTENPVGQFVPRAAPEKALS